MITMLVRSNRIRQAPLGCRCRRYCSANPDGFVRSGEGWRVRRKRLINSGKKCRVLRRARIAYIASMGVLFPLTISAAKSSKRQLGVGLFPPRRGRSRRGFPAASGFSPRRAHIPCRDWRGRTDTPCPCRRRMGRNWPPPGHILQFDCSFL